MCACVHGVQNEGPGKKKKKGKDLELNCVLKFEDAGIWSESVSRKWNLFSIFLPWPPFFSVACNFDFESFLFTKQYANLFKLKPSDGVLIRSSFHCFVVYRVQLGVKPVGGHRRQRKLHDCITT